MSVQSSNFPPMDNYFIADQFSMLAKLMDIHGENTFRAKSYSIAAYNIEQLKDPLPEMDRNSIAAQKGIGDSTAKKILEILDTGRLKALDDIIASTPTGVLELLQVKGLGPKKIATIWKEMGIESIGELLYACQENRLLMYKGFGAKTQQNVKEAIEFLLRHKDKFLYAEVCAYAESFEKVIREKIPGSRFAVTGAFRMQSVVLDALEWVTTAPPGQLSSFLADNGYSQIESTDDAFRFRGPENIPVTFHHATNDTFAKRLFETSCSSAFREAWGPLHTEQGSYKDEEEIFRSAGLPFIPACRREDESVITLARTGMLKDTIGVDDIKGIIHSHSTWSDGSQSISDMAKACIGMGMEYLVISDHSRSASYAGGLSIEKILEQHAEIDALNSAFAPFHIFKSIECDILGDGRMDYPDEVLATFDLVIASIHSNLKMTEEKAMQRLLTAIENPYTTILGHMTGRLLLSRPGYPVDHLRIIDACAAHNVTIEINAHPRRLDIDWSWIQSAMNKGVRLSINPDAHSAEGFRDIRFGVLAAQKGGLTKAFNLSSMSRMEIGEYLENRKSGQNR